MEGKRVAKVKKKEDTPEKKRLFSRKDYPTDEA